MVRLIFLFGFLLFFRESIAQQKSYPDYHPPLLLPQKLAANFGELRPNHFHMGLDFRTEGKIGHNLHSIDDGFVSRINFSPYGYGNVIYVDHPDGNTSVYAHCSGFVGKIDSLLYARQAAQSCSEIEIFLKPHELPVKKGEVIAISGNSGSSTGPHLHFELRDTKTEHALNPLVYGFDIADTIVPSVQKLKVFAVSKDGYQFGGLSKEVVISNVKGQLKIANDTLILPAKFCSETGGIGFAFDGSDRLNASPNICGLYGTYLLVDDDTTFGMRIDRISFDHTRFINTHRDLKSSGKYHKSYRTKTNPLEIYINDNLGVITTKPNDIKRIKLIAYDPQGNKTELNFVLKIADGVISPDYAPNRSSHLYPEDSISIEKDNWSIYLPHNSVYEPVPFSQSNEPMGCSATVLIQNKTKVAMELENPLLPIEKYYLAVQSSNGRKYLSTTYKDGWLYAQSKYAGKFSIQTDTLPPTMKPLSISSALTVKSQSVKFSVYESQTALKCYSLFIDGIWHRMEYETKGGYIFFQRPADLVGAHQLKIILTDACNNELVYEKMVTFL